MPEHDYDLLDLDLHTIDPWPCYTYLREEAPIYYDKHNELWAVSRYEDIIAISSDQETYCSTEGALPNLPPDPSMIHQGGDQHSKQRRLISSGFTPSRMRKLETDVRNIIVELMEGVKPQGRCELVEDITRVVPLRVIGDMLGHPREDHTMLGGWTDVCAGGGSGPQHVTDETNDAFMAFCEYHEQAIEKRKENPGDDLLTVWLNAEIDGEKLDEDQLLFEHLLIFVGGSETTRNVMTVGTQMLIEHPDQRQYFIDNIDDPDVNKAAIEEMIRWTTPFVRMVRTTTREVEIHGQKIPEGQQIMMMYPPATRDPRAFENPDVFDIRRPPKKSNLAFGHGRHLCLGANLARLELRLYFDELLRRIPNMRLDSDNAAVKKFSSFQRGLQALPVVWDV